eukprot:scaffold47182_cov57-Phaeocystis_antarctica.AAC.3
MAGLEHISRKVESNSHQAAAALAGSLPALRPQGAHGGRRTVLQRQRRQHMRYQITREQHSLDQPLRQRIIRGEDSFGVVRDFGRCLASCDSDLVELRVRELEETRRQSRGWHHPEAFHYVSASRRGPANLGLRGGE